MTRSKIYSLLVATGLFFVQGALAEDTVIQEIPTSQSYSTALSERPFTLPGGIAEVGGNMKVSTDGGAFSLDTVHISLGVTDDLQLGVSWGGMYFPSLNPSRFLNVSLGSFLFANNWIASMASFEVPFHFVGEAVRNVTFSMPTVVPIVKGISIVTLNASLIDFKFANQKFGASFNFPISLAVQMTQRLALDVSTRIARFEVGQNVSSLYFWDDMPVRLRGLYAINNALDVVGNIGFDSLSNPKDSFSFTVGAQFRIGSLG